jgi:hypothetical protein
MGARFDMEVDAFLILVLSAHVAGAVGAWALAIGAMRYAFVAAGWALPWLRGPLPPSLAGKTVAALQGVVLVVAGAGVLDHPAAVGLVATALTLLCWSFGRDVLRLRRGRGREGRLHTGRTPEVLAGEIGAPDVRVPAILAHEGRVAEVRIPEILVREVRVPRQRQAPAPVTGPA